MLTRARYAGILRSMNVKIEPSWKNILSEEFESEYFAKLASFVKDAYRRGVVYPPGRFIFEAFNRTPFDKEWRPVALGRPRGLAAERHAYGLWRREHGGIASGQRMGTIHRRCDTRTHDKARWDRLSSVGLIRPAQSRIR